MMKMYRTSYGTIIQEIEVSRLTEKMVFYVNERGREERELLTATHYRWHESREAAKANLLETYSAEKRGLEQRLARCENTLKEINAL